MVELALGGLVCANSRIPGVAGEVVDVTEHVALRVLRHGAAEPGADSPEYTRALFDGPILDVEAAQEREAPSLDEFFAQLDEPGSQSGETKSRASTPSIGKCSVLRKATSSSSRSFLSSRSTHSSRPRISAPVHAAGPS